MAETSAEVLTKIASLARQHTEKGIEILGGLATAHPDPEVKLRALQMLFDRGWGKPATTTEVTGKDGQTIEIIVRHITEGSKAPQR